MSFFPLYECLNKRKQNGDSWKNLCPNVFLFEQYKKKILFNGIDDGVSKYRSPVKSIASHGRRNTREHDRRTTREHVKKWMEDGTEENNQFLTDDNIIEGVMVREKDDYDNDGNKGGEAVAL